MNKQKERLSHQEVLELLGYDHESELQFDLHDFRHIINASDIINSVRFLKYY